MPIPQYSVLAGHPVDGELVWPHNHQKPPHYMIKVRAGSKTYQVAVNVQSQDFSEVLYLIDFQFRPPQEDALRALSPGLTSLDSEPGGLALDFVRQGLVRPEDMTKLPKPSLGHGSQLLGAIQTLAAAARQDPDSTLYAFGSAFPDGIHDIHMNQGNPPPHEGDNGTWRDGAVFVFLPSSQRWIGVFLAFQTQVWTTDAKGNPAAVVTEAAPVSFAVSPAEAAASPFVPRSFAATRPTLAQPSASRPAGVGNQFFHKLPPPTRPAPYRMELAEVVPPEEMARMTASGRLVFHVAGDTGNAGHDLGYQLNVAKHMERQMTSPNAGDRPLFFYHLGDVVYFNGEESKYASQFFDVYDYYKAPILAIPGNHDGDNLPGDTSLGAFVKNFCAPTPTHPAAAHEAVRDAMTQPNPYWTLRAPLVTIIGLYTNVPEHGLLDDPAATTRPQEEWFWTELAEAPTDRPLIVALHHPPYSLDKYHGNSQRMEAMLERAMVKTRRVPAVVFTGHVHNYQRFTRLRGTAQIPHVVHGCGGYPSFHQMLAAFPKPSPTPWPDVTLDNYEVTRKGFMRVTVTDALLTCEFFTVPLPSEPEDGPTVLGDRFVLDWKTNLLVNDDNFAT
jgi:acid phosphatase type 7